MNYLIEHIAIVRQNDETAVMMLLTTGLSDEDIAAEVERTVAAWSEHPEWLPIKGWSRMDTTEIVEYHDRREKASRRK